MKINHRIAVILLFAFLLIVGPAKVVAQVNVPNINYVWVQWYVQCGADVIEAQKKYNGLRKLQGASTVALLSRWAISNVVQEYTRNENDGYFLPHLQACWQTKKAWDGIVKSEKNYYCSK